LQVALDRALVAYRRIVGILVKLAAGSALAKQIPAAVQLYLDAGQALVRIRRSSLLVESLERVLLLDQLLDLAEDAFIVHGCSSVS
jgi:hypothetical protein